jgi:hypothetical protein
VLSQYTDPPATLLTARRPAAERQHPAEPTGACSPQDLPPKGDVMARRNPLRRAEKQMLTKLDKTLGVAQHDQQETSKKAGYAELR